MNLPVSSRSKLVGRVLALPQHAPVDATSGEDAHRRRDQARIDLKFLALVGDVDRPR